SLRIAYRHAHAESALGGTDPADAWSPRCPPPLAFHVPPKPLPRPANSRASNSAGGLLCLVKRCANRTLALAASRTEELAGRLEIPSGYHRAQPTRHHPAPSPETRSGPCPSSISSLPYGMAVGLANTKLTVATNSAQVKGL